MTKDEAKKAAEVMMACANGATIQFRRRGCYTDSWEELKKDEEPLFDWISWVYRVKPQQKLVPFTHEDVEKFMGKPLKHKVYENTFCMVVEANTDYLWIGAAGEPNSYKHLLEKYTFLDGSPSGKIVEE